MSTKTTTIAEDQLKRIIDRPLLSSFAFTSDEWQRLAKLWLLISNGRYVRYLTEKDERSLRKPGVREECEAVARRYRILLNQAVRDIDSESAK